MKSLHAWCQLLACLVFADAALAADLGPLPGFNPRDCVALETRQTYYGSLLKSGENYAKAAEKAMKKGSRSLAATNIIDGYRYAHASRLTWEVEYHQEWIPHVTNAFGTDWHKSVLSSIRWLQGNFAAVQKRQTTLLQRLQSLAENPELEPLVKGTLAAMEREVKEDDPGKALETLRTTARPVINTPPSEGRPEDQMRGALEGGNLARAIRIAMANPTNPACGSLLKQELEKSGLTPPEAATAAGILLKGRNATQEELEKLFQMNKLHPNNAVLHEIKMQLLIARGLSPEEAERIIRQGGFPPSPPPPAGSVLPTATSKIIDANGVALKPEEIIKLFDKDGKPLLTGYKVQYLARPGQEIGKIQWEEERLRSYKRSGQADTFIMTENAGKRVDWAMQIKEASRDNLRITYKLMELEHPAQDFTIDEWVMKPAAGQPLQRGTGKEFEVTFPGPGEYVIQVTGKTEWGNPFVEEVTVPL